MEETTNNEMNNQILESLERLNQNEVKVINTLNDIQEYLIIQDKKQEEKEEEELKSAEEKALQDKQKEEEENQTRAEQSAQSETQQQTYEELLVEIRDEQRLTNQMFAGTFLFYGLICGILLFKILWDKLN